MIGIRFRVGIRRKPILGNPVILASILIRSRVARVHSCGSCRGNLGIGLIISQRAQYPVIREYTLHQNIKAPII